MPTLPTKLSLCSQCNVAMQRADLQFVAGQWRCPTCIDLLANQKMVRGELVLEDEDEMTGDDVEALVRAARFTSRSQVEGLAGPQDVFVREEPTLDERFGALVRWGFLVMRGVAYLVFWLLARSNPTMGIVFQGFLTADVVTWIVKAFFDLREGSLGVVLEFVAFFPIVWLFCLSRGTLALPDRPDDRAVLALSFGVFFTIRGAYHLMHWRFRSNELV